jgi:hypothetical protein
MALQLYATADSSSSFSLDSEFSNPVIYSFDGVGGGTIVKQYYLRNDDSTKYYTGITIAPYVSSGTDITDGTNGFSWKMISGVSKPLEQQWTLVDDGNSLSMEDIGSSGSGDDVTYYPFWLRITVPPNTSIQSFENAKLRIEANQYIV